MSRTSTATIFPTLAWTVVLLAAYTLPPLWLRTAATAHDAHGFAVFALLLLNPALTLVVSLVAAMLQRTWALPLGAALAWVPAALLAYNDSALVYAVLYLICSALGTVIGALTLRAQEGAHRPRGRVTAA